MFIYDEYRTETIRAIEKCQFIEETLKLCILSAIEITEIMVSPFFPFNYKEKDIIKLPMGPLVKKFIRINSDSALHTELNDIIKDRNYVAHQSLLFTLGELSDNDSMNIELEKIKKIGNRAENIHKRLLNVRCSLIKAKNEAKANVAKNNA